MGDDLVPNGLSMVCNVRCSRSIYPRIVAHEADEPNAVVDLLYAEALTGGHGETLICMLMRPQAVTRVSPSWNGYSISERPS